MPVNVPAFLVTTMLLAMLPGAGQALILRQTLTQGRRTAWTTVAGTATGLVVWSSFAAAGLSAVLLANPAAYLALRVAGGVVLAVLGVSSLRAMRRHRAGQEPAPPRERGAFLAGLATNLGNPKSGVFAIFFIPQFIHPGPYVFASGLFLGALWAGTTTCWYLLFIWAADHGRALFTRPSVTIWLHGITGAVLLILGAAVVAGA